MVNFQDFKGKKPKEILAEMNEGKMGKTSDTPFQVANATIQIKIVEQLCEVIKTTGETLFKASTMLKESTDESIKTLKTSIDDFRKSNKKTSKVLIALTAVVGFATLVQAFYAVMLLLKK